MENDLSGMAIVIRFDFKVSLTNQHVSVQYAVQEAHMEAITYTAARQNLAKTMDKVCDDHSPIIVTRKSTNVVIMSLEDYEALEETAYLLRSPKNAMRLLESITQLENGKGHERELKE